MQPKIIDLNEVMHGMSGLLERVIREDIHITSFFQNNLWAVQADPSQIEQVIVNLVINARDAMPTGGKLHIETANVELDDAFVRRNIGSQAGPHVCFTVKDNGTGMDKEVLSHIFEPFFTTKETGEGTGLGLATVYGIVKQSGGYISVHTVPEQGTVFKVYLPKAEGKPICEEPPVVALSPGGSETILVVEDNEAVRSLVTTTLQRDGYSVLDASNGREAERIWSERQDSIALVLTDVVMPLMSGPDFVRKIRDGHPHVKIVYMSGHTAEALSQEQLQAGDGFIQKPFTPAVLQNKVRSALDQRLLEAGGAISKSVAKAG